MYDYQAEKLFIKKSDIESALGISLDDVPTKKFSFLDENNNPTATLEDYLKPYALMDRFTLDESIALLLGENPDNPFREISEHYSYNGTRKLLEREINSGRLHNISEETYSLVIELSHSELEQWAKRYGYNWKLPPYSSSDTNQNLKKPETQAELNRINTELEQAKATIQAKDEQIAELEKQLEQAKRAESAVKSDDVLIQPKQGRISQPQRDLFSLLVLKNYQDYQSRNALFDAINADMKEHGIRTNDIKYPTLDNLIDDNLRINGLSIFPSKQK